MSILKITSGAIVDSAKEPSFWGIIVFLYLIWGLTIFLLMEKNKTINKLKRKLEKLR